jgi:dTDP-4-amino-4,6-dideoxygalactose transaminase
VTVPVADPSRWFARHADEVAAVQSRVLESGRFILGPEVARFEEEFAAFCGAQHAVAVASGTDALTLSLYALGAAGGEVITSAHTAVATLAAIERAGARPVLADIDAGSHCLDPASVRKRLGPDTRAVVAVHMHGHPANMAALADVAAAHGVPVVEDASQAHGARIDGAPVGAIGIAGAFSFYPTKSIGAMGDAGAVVTSDPHLARELRRLRQYGWDDTRVSQRGGFNSRMDDVQAALLRLRLRYFDEDFARRQALARRYLDVLAGASSIAAPRVGPGAIHGFHHFIVQTPARDELAAFLGSRGIDSARYYEQPVYEHPAYARLGGDGGFGNTRRLYATMLAVPVFPELADNEADRIVQALAEWTRHKEQQHP